MPRYGSTDQMCNVVDCSSILPPSLLRCTHNLFHFSITLNHNGASVSDWTTRQVACQVGVCVINPFCPSLVNSSSRSRMKI